MKPTRWVAVGSVCLSIFLVAGCQVDYYAQLVFGELGSLLNTVPVEEALNGSRLTAEEKSQLALTQAVRQFGIDTIGLYAGNAYTLFEANGTSPAAYALCASAKEALAPYVWFFPIFGPSVVKTFFDRDMAQREADLLKFFGYDVFLARVDGFSTLGILPDPVRQSNLRLDSLELAELILHEMTHSTVFKADDTNFSESLATFLGRTAAQAWVDQMYGVDSPEAAAARARYADEAIIDEYVNALYLTMEGYYEESAAAGRSREEIIAGREEQFASAAARYATDYEPRLIDPEHWGPVAAMELNNARIMTAYRYQGGMDVYQAVLDRVGGDFAAAIAVFRDAAAAPGDSKDYLQNWVAGH